MTYRVPAEVVLESIESPGEELELVEAKVGEDGDLWIRADSNSKADTEENHG